MPLEKHLPFSLEEYRSRLRSLWSGIEAAGLDGIVVTDPEDLFYLTGYRNMGIFIFQALVVVPGRTPAVVLRSVARASFDQTAWTGEVREYGDDADPVEALADAMRGIGLAGGRIGLPKRSPYFVADHAERLQATFPAGEWRDSSPLVMRLRLVKSAAEIAYIRRATAIAEQAVWAGVREAVAGRTENQVAAAMVSTMILAGSETPAKNPLIGSGPRSAQGHVSWEGRPLASGDLVFLEPGACVCRYHAALMRTAAVGPPAERWRRWADACAAGANAAIEAMRPGATCAEVDAACRRAIARAGCGAFFQHRSGYSIGLGFANWIEGLSLRPGDHTPLAAGMVFHVVPFLHDRDGGVAVSEMVLVTDGGAERLSTLPQALLSAELAR